VAAAEQRGQALRQRHVTEMTACDARAERLREALRQQAARLKDMDAELYAAREAARALEATLVTTQEERDYLARQADELRQRFSSDAGLVAAASAGVASLAASGRLHPSQLPRLDVHPLTREQRANHSAAAGGKMAAHHAHHAHQLSSQHLTATEGDPDVLLSQRALAFLAELPSPAAREDAALRTPVQWAASTGTPMPEAAGTPIGKRLSLAGTPANHVSGSVSGSVPGSVSGSVSGSPSLTAPPK